MEKVYLECTIRILEMKMSMKQIHQPHGSQCIGKFSSKYHNKEPSHVALSLEKTVEGKGK